MKTPKETLERELARRLNAERTRAGYSQSELADLVHVPRTTISNIEGGRQGIPVPLLYELCRALQTSPGEFLPTMDEFEEMIRQSLEVKEDKASAPPKVAAALSAFIAASQEQR